ncbi:hypothetical protein C8J56DRAFT_1172586 [Mycena floridula]|nr:hypothetical protein C8J56DRAFT_1172586 [Mycena floridula]
METPPTTPQHQHDLECQNEQDNRVMDTLQHCRLPRPVLNTELAPHGEDPFLDVDRDGQTLRLSQGIGTAV